VLAPLRVLGYEPEAIDLPGHGRSTEPLTDLHGDADAVRVRLDAIGEPTLLVGHSYGGMVITDAGTHDAVIGLAYVAAYLPDTGQTLLDLFTAPAPPTRERPSELVAAVRFSHDRSEMRLGGDGVAGALYGDCDPATQQWAIARLDAQSTASFTQAPRRVAWKSRPATYVVCTQDRTIPAWLQRTMAVPADRVIDLPASHSPFLSMPGRLAGVIAEADPASGAGRAGRCGGADSRHAPAPATTSDKPRSNQEGHDLRLGVCRGRGRGLGGGGWWKRCCVGEEGWPFGAALRGASNHHLLRWLKTVVVSEVETAHEMRQVGPGRRGAVPAWDRC
jgi:pimeloyl-ACP methyl ester carboxylesterase